MSDLIGIEARGEKQITLGGLSELIATDKRLNRLFRAEFHGNAVRVFRLSDTGNTLLIELWQSEKRIYGTRPQRSVLHEWALERLMHTLASFLCWLVWDEEDDASNYSYGKTQHTLWSVFARKYDQLIQEGVSENSAASIVRNLWSITLDSLPHDFPQEDIGFPERWAT